ncbi:hypothetical protein [Agromyces sp. NPDC057865]|uniref:hypothetical protein n=1 Tax=Agromyces sp. NPDC057865 TaxID=3346267 RepID=UPI00366B84F3
MQLLFGGGADTVIHFVLGAGFVVFATSVFDFGLPRWINVIGAVAAGAFGLIFILQGVADVTRLEGIRDIAFGVFGQWPERILPYFVYVWFIALLLLDSRGKSRILGWVIMPIVVVVELATLVSLLLAIPMVNLKVVLLLPFVWLLFESAEREPAPSSDPSVVLAPNQERRES